MYKNWMERMQNRREETTGAPDAAGAAAPAVTETATTAATTAAAPDKKVEDAGNVSNRPGMTALTDPGEDGLADLTPEQLRARILSDRQRISAAELRAQQAQERLTPLEQAEQARREAAERERPLADKLRTREEDLKAARAENDKLTTRVRNADLHDQLRRAGYSDSEISDIVDLAAPDEILYDAAKGAYSLDMPRFVARKAHYSEPASRTQPDPKTSTPQGLPSTRTERPKKWTRAEIAALPNAEYQRRKKEIWEAGVTD